MLGVCGSVPSKDGFCTLFFVMAAQPEDHLSLRRLDPEPPDASALVPFLEINPFLLMQTSADCHINIGAEYC